MKLKYFYKRRFTSKLSFIPFFKIVFALFSLAASILLVFYFPPTYQISIQQYHFPILYLFFISLFSFLFFIIAIILRSKKHGFFIGLFVVTYLIFRLNDLTHPLFVFLLIALFLVTEFLFTGHNDKQ